MKIFCIVQRIRLAESDDIANGISLDAMQVPGDPSNLEFFRIAGP
ncbi:hypothetical protein [uncultured Duncaniella sp.]|nr:hypothetical protein [uncultured Duncaniella sp.]